jgi:hypothetical protein
MQPHATVDPKLPYLRPWLRLALVIRQIRSTTWDAVTWPTAQEALLDALKMQKKTRGSSTWN